MTDETRRLTRCLTFIKENTSQVEKILDKLVEDEVIGLDERAQILTHPLMENQIHAIIETIIRKKAHQSFLRALANTGNNHVVDRIQDLNIQRDINRDMNKEKTFTIKTVNDDAFDEKAQMEMLVKEKTLEQLKMENDRLKTQQSIVREQLNQKHKKIQELKLEVQNCKIQNSEMMEKLENYNDLQARMEHFENELQDKEKMNKIIEIALVERSEEIFRLQRECDELKTENEEKTEQIALLSNQMASLKEELQKASKDRRRLERTIVEMSENMEEKFKDMMAALTELKSYRQAQCEVTTPRINSSRYQYGRLGKTFPPPKSKMTSYLNKNRR